MPNRPRVLFNERTRNFRRGRDRETKSCKNFCTKFNDCYLLLGLGLCMTIYLLLGAAVLTTIEGNAEQVRIDAAVVDQQRLLNNLTETCNASWNDVLRIMNAFQYSCESGLLVKSKMARLWDYSGALFFAITVVTTIGYGHIAPSTASGKAFCVFYALIGIPLCLILLALIGKIILQMMKFVYAFVRRKPVVARFSGLCVLAVIGLAFFAIIPAVIISAVEGWDYGVSLYYTFVSCSTIGFGDLVAGQQDDKPINPVLRSLYKLCVGVWLFLGMGALATVISTIKDAMVFVWKRIKRRFRALTGRNGGTASLPAAARSPTGENHSVVAISPTTPSYRNVSTSPSGSGREGRVVRSDLERVALIVGDYGDSDDGSPVPRLGRIDVQVVPVQPPSEQPAGPFETPNMWVASSELEVVEEMEEDYLEEGEVEGMGVIEE